MDHPLRRERVVAQSPPIRQGSDLLAVKRTFSHNSSYFGLIEEL